MPSQPLITLSNIHFSRGERVIFAGVDMEIERGAVTAVMGPSGTGKTTLLRLIGGQLRPDSGTLLVGGEEVARLGRTALYAMRRQMGVLFQSGALFTDLTVFDNVAFPLREHTRLPESMIRTLVLMKLESVGLRGARDLMPSQLSGGMARRVAMARAIALDPTLMLYDEPFTGQDPVSMGVLVKLIRELNDSLGLTSVVVSHDVQETASIADYIYLVAGGRVVGHGTPAELEGSDSPWIRQFMHGEPDGPLPFHYPAPSIKEELMGVSSDD
jgi:phospholipid/cholesterol/gamma-HCH transport system ATP-binding protein